VAVDGGGEKRPPTIARVSTREVTPVAAERAAAATVEAGELLASRARSRLATLPTPLERGPGLPGGVRLWVKRDDLTGLGAGGNKARKLEFLCGEALEVGAGALVTVGAAQSNHCRITAAAGAVLGLEVHLVLSGDRPLRATGNQLLSTLFGAQLHYVGCPDNHWGELEIAREQLTAELASGGIVPHSIPIGGSTAAGALGYVGAYVELVEQCRAAGIAPAAVVHASSSGGTHAGLIAGRALLRSFGHEPLPPVLAIGVAKGVNAGVPDVGALARDTLALLGADPTAVTADDVEVDGRWLGADYGVPTDAGDEAIRWAAVHGGWVLDRTYSGKGFAGLLGGAVEGRWRPGTEVVFLHTGGLPSVFAPEGAPVASVT
jgi:1-aminocyclopropane-1-carboxylate deaminase/D-cysteine desulfhydrase-like pyridoxal-dependent ACC family enzyme